MGPEKNGLVKGAPHQEGEKYVMFKFPSNPGHFLILLLHALAMWSRTHLPSEGGGHRLS